MLKQVRNKILTENLVVKSLVIVLVITTPLTFTVTVEAQRTQNQNDFSELDGAIRLNPQNPQLWFNRGSARLRIGNYSDALEDFDQVIRLNPGFFIGTYAYQNRGTAKYYLERYAEAVEDYSQAIQMYPDSSTAYYHRGLARLRIGEQQAAFSDFEQATQLNPSLKNNKNFKELRPLL